MDGTYGRGDGDCLDVCGKCCCGRECLDGLDGKGGGGCLGGVCPRVGDDRGFLDGLDGKGGGDCLVTGSNAIGGLDDVGGRDGGGWVGDGLRGA